jgi:hypothetical protein
VYNYRIFVCAEEIIFFCEKSSQKLALSMTRPSCADPFSVQVCTTLRIFLVCSLLPLPSKRATFCFDMVEFAVLQHQRPGRREKARHVFAFGPFVHSRTNEYSKDHTNHPYFLSPPTPSRKPYLQGTATLRLQPTTPYAHTRSDDRGTDAIETIN